MPKTLEMQLLATYLNLATRRVNAGTAISSRIASRLAVDTIGEAALYGQQTLALQLSLFTKRYSDANNALEEINLNRSEVY
jgi:hypothetical protein